MVPPIQTDNDDDDDEHVSDNSEEEVSEDGLTDRDEEEDINENLEVNYTFYAATNGVDFSVKLLLI